MKCQEYQLVTKVKKREYEVDVDGLKKLLKSSRRISKFHIADELSVPVTMVEHWFRNDKYFAIPQAELWDELKRMLGIESDEFDHQVKDFVFQDGVFEMGNRAYGTCGVAPTLKASGETYIVCDE